MAQLLKSFRQKHEYPNSDTPRLMQKSVMVVHVYNPILGERRQKDTWPASLAKTVISKSSRKKNEVKMSF